MLTKINKCGIYCLEAISCKLERIGWKYIGQTKSLFEQRKNEHLRTLKKNKHFSIKLQRFYNKYGSESLKFGVLMECPENELNFWETFWIKCFDSHKNGFNCTDGGENPPIRYSKCTLKNIKTGEVEEHDSIKSFAQKHNFCRVGVRETMNGKQRFIKNWYNPEKVTPIFYTVISPIGEKICIPENEVKDFCDKNGLEPLYFRGLLRGQRETTENGWKRPDSKKTKSDGISKDFKVVSPNGEVISGHNITQFCKKNNLCPSKLCEVLNGKISNYKGWKKYNNNL